MQQNIDVANDDGASWHADQAKRLIADANRCLRLAKQDRTGRPRKAGAR